MEVASGRNSEETCPVWGAAGLLLGRPVGPGVPGGASPSPEAERPQVLPRPSPGFRARVSSRDSVPFAFPCGRARPSAQVCPPRSTHFWGLSTGAGRLQSVESRVRVCGADRVPAGKPLVGPGSRRGRVRGGPQGWFQGRVGGAREGAEGPGSCRKLKPGESVGHALLLGAARGQHGGWFGHLDLQPHSVPRPGQKPLLG